MNGLRASDGSAILTGQFQAETARSDRDVADLTSRAGICPSPAPKLAQNTAGEAQAGTLRGVHAGRALRQPPGLRHRAGRSARVRDRRGVGDVRSRSGRRAQTVATLQRKDRRDRAAAGSWARARAPPERPRADLPLAGWPEVGGARAPPAPRSPVRSARRHRRCLRSPGCVADPLPHATANAGRTLHQS